MHNGSNRYWLLAKPGILRLLVILYEHGSMPIHHVPRHGMGVGTTYRSANEAAMYGLVRLYRCGSSKCVELTPEGRRVAEKIAEVLKTLEDLNLVEPLPAEGEGGRR